MKFLYSLLTGTLFLSLTACSDSVSERNQEVANAFNEAYAELDDGDLENALEICDRLTDSSDSINMSWLEYCRAATIYAVCYEHGICGDSDISKATRWLFKAMELQPDSTRLFIANLDPDYVGALNTVRHTLDWLTIDRSNMEIPDESDFMETDSADIVTNHDHDHKI